MCSKSGPVVAYCASKTLAEKGGFLNVFRSSSDLFLVKSLAAAWDFYEQQKPQIKWDLVAIIPPPVSFLLFYKNLRQLLRPVVE